MYRCPAGTGQVPSGSRRATDGRPLARVKPPMPWDLTSGRRRGGALGGRGSRGVALAGDPDVVAIDLAADPAILDAGTGS
jgi:hypothetical protein